MNIAHVRSLTNELLDFIEARTVRDTKLVADFYPDYYYIGASLATGPTCRGPLLSYY